MSLHHCWRRKLSSSLCTNFKLETNSDAFNRGLKQWLKSKQQCSHEYLTAALLSDHVAFALKLMYVFNYECIGSLLSFQYYCTLHYFPLQLVTIDLFLYFYCYHSFPLKASCGQVLRISMCAKHSNSASGSSSVIVMSMSNKPNLI